MTVFGKQPKMVHGTDLANGKRKKPSEKKKREMQESFKRLKVKMEETRKKTSSKAAPKKRRSLDFEVEAELEKLEEEVAGKTAETTVMRQQLVEGDIGVEAGLEKVNELRTFNALLFLENLRDRNLVNDLTRRIFG